MNVKQALKSENLWLWLILLLGVVLRIFQFDQWSLTNDELSTLHRLNYPNLKVLIEKGVREDSHPALLQVFTFYWTHFFGNSPFALRLPFVILGIGTLIYFKKIASTFLNKKAALFALSIFALSQLFVVYSQIARPYVLGLFFTLAFTYYWNRIIFHPGKKIQAFLFVLTAFLASISHYLATLSILLIYLSGFLLLNKKNRLRYFLLGLLILVLFSPHIPITLEQLGHKSLSWLPLPQPDFILQFLDFCFNHSLIFWLFTSLGLIPFLLSANYLNKTLNLKRIILFFLFAIPYLTAYFYSINVGAILQFSILIFSFPFLLLFFASFIRERFPFKYVLIISLILTLLGLKSLIFDLELYNKKPFANFKDVAKHIIDWNENMSEMNVLNFSNSNSADYLNYYFRQMNDSVSLDISIFDDERKIGLARDLINSTSKPYVLIAFGNTPVPKEVHEFCKQKFPQKIKQKRYFNSEAILYGKSNHKENSRKYIFQTSAKQFKNNPKWSVDESLIQSDNFYSNSAAFFLPENTEFTLTYRDSIKNVFLNDQSFLTISAFLYHAEEANVKLVCSIERGGKNIYWRGIDSRDFAKENQWYQLLYVLEKTDKIKDQDQLSIYFWNPDKSKLWIDDFKITLFEDSDYNYYERF